MSDELQNAATIASLRAEVERLKAELQGEREDLAEKCKAYGDSLVEETKLTTHIAELTSYAERLLAENVRLSNEAADLRSEVSAIGTRLSMEQEDHEATRKELDAVVILLKGARVALDTARERAGVLEAEVRAWRDAVNTLDMISEHPDHQHCISGEWDDGRKCDDCKLWSDAVRCRRETDRTHALDAAKFAKEQNDG